MSSSSKLSRSHMESVRALKALGTVGGRSPWVVAMVLGLGVLVGSFSDAIPQLIRLVLKSRFGLSDLGIEIVILLIAAALGVAAIVWLRYRADKVAENDLRPAISTEAPDPVEVLILFVSPPPLPGSGNFPKDPAGGKEARQQAVEHFLKTLEPGRLTDPAWRGQAALGRHNWRMPCEAVAYHLQMPRMRLKKVILIGSADRQRDDGTIDYGTNIYDDVMKPWLQQLINDCGAEAEVLTLGELEILPRPYKPGKGYSVDLDKGMDFENLELVSWLLYDLYRALKDKKGYAEKDILVDVTGGQKINTVAGAIFAVLVPKRRFQYVSTINYEVRSYDATLEVPDFE